MDIYGTVDGFLDYHELRANSVPIAAQADDDLITASLGKASEWFDASYLSQFEGFKTGGRDQEREWPRIGHTDYYGYSIASDLIPREVENAIYEAALADLNSPGALSIDYTPAKFKSVAVSGAVSVQYAEFDNAAEIQTKFASIERIVSTLFRKGNSGAKYSGAIARM